MFIKHRKSGQGPFSVVLMKIYADLPSQGMTLRQLLDKLGSRGRLALCILLSVPFLLPVSIPGSSTPFGLVMAIVGIGVITDKPIHLPRFLADKNIEMQYLQPILHKAINLIGRIERFTHPRYPMLTGKLSSIINGLVMILSAVLLMIPMPLPFANTIPAYGVLFLAAGNLEKDGLLILAGYFMTTLSILYFWMLFFLGIEGVQALFPKVFNLFSGN